MLKKILVAIGGFSYSQKVVYEAKQLAEAMGSEITIMNVVDISREEHYISNKDFLEDIKKGAMEQSEKMLHSAKAKFVDFKGDIDTVSKVGNAADEIINYAEIGSYDLIIVGSRSTGVFTRGQLGSIADKVVHYSRVPVYIIK